MFWFLFFQKAGEDGTTKVNGERVHCEEFSLTPPVIFVPLQATEKVEAI